MRRQALWLALLAGLTSAHAAAAAAAPPTIDRYTAAIHAIRVSVDRMASSQRVDVTAISRLRAQLRALRSVQLPDGRVLQTDMPGPVDELAAGDPAALQGAARELDSLDDSLRGQPAAHADPARLAELDTVLRDPRFHPHKNPWQLLQDWIRSELSKLFSRFFGHVQLNSTAAFIFAIFFLALVAAVALLAARGALRQMAVEATSSEETPEPTGSNDAEERASSLSGVGDYRAALRYLFLGVMLTLQERGVLALRPELTNREYLGTVRRSARYPAEMEEALQGLIDAFDRVWYGHQPFGAADYARCEDLARQVVATLQPGAPWRGRVA